VVAQTRRLRRFPVVRAVEVHRVPERRLQVQGSVVQACFLPKMTDDVVQHLTVMGDQDRYRVMSGRLRHANSSLPSGHA
jgi:hypothetical protein